jgi:hypothetical protein
MSLDTLSSLAVIAQGLDRLYGETKDVLDAETDEQSIAGLEEFLVQIESVFSEVQRKYEDQWNGSTSYLPFKELVKHWP